MLQITRHNPWTPCRIHFSAHCCASGGKLRTHGLAIVGMRLLIHPRQREGQKY